MKKTHWKELRMFNSRKEIIFKWFNYELRMVKWFSYNIWHVISKYKHHHAYNRSMKCLICRKYKRDIDYERLKKI